MTDTAAAEAVPQRFSMLELPLLETGMTTTPLGHAANLWVHGKVYSRGGENALHAHQIEDHLFFVLQGEARFEFADGATQDLGPLEGFLLPKGVLYRFEARGEGNLVMLRVGAAQIDSGWSGVRRQGAPEEIRVATGLDGRPLKSGSKEKGRTPAEAVKVLKGRFVADGLAPEVGDPCHGMGDG